MSQRTRWMLFALFFAGTGISCGSAETDGDDRPIVIINNGSENANTENSGTVNSGTMNSGTVNSGTVNSGANAAPNNGTPNNRNSVTAHPHENVLRGLVGLGSLVADDVGTMVSNVVEAVWFASEQTGTPTMTGTITQQGQSFSYSPSPSDRLVVAAGGQNLEIVVHAMDGYSDGTWEDFSESHDMDFTISAANAMELRITSSSRWQDCDDPAYTTCYGWDRTAAGFVVVEGERSDLDLADSGRTRYSVSGDFALYNTGRNTTGSAQSASGSIQIDEGSSSDLAHNRISAQQTRNFSMGVNSSATIDGTTYAAQDIVIYWEDANSLTQQAVPLVSQPDYWEARGTVARDGQPYGVIAFDGDVVKNTSGPRVALRLDDGTTIVLFKPIEG